MGMIKNFKDLVGKEVAVCYPSPDKLTLFWVGGGDLQIKNGSNVWRVLDEDGHILMSSADLFFLSTPRHKTGLEDSEHQKASRNPLANRI